jgi:NAD(P)-dependent dehydrogenase (short-subunit alcohol dehydrogenase family)
MTGEQSVVVTGVSTGIGWGIAKVLIANDFTVFGSVRETTLRTSPAWLR